MPRTKVSKSSKRNREAASREEKIREYENTFEGFQNTFESLMQDNINSYKQQFTMLLQRTNSALLQIKICDLLEMDLDRIDDWEKKSKLLSAKNAQNSMNVSSSTSLQRSTKIANPNDEGYLTEDSSAGGSLSGASTLSNAAFLNSSALRPQTSSSQQQTSRLRTPGPLNSARARRPRRSRSACGDYGVVPGSAIKSKPSVALTAATAATDHVSRNKMRTPMATKTKAFSCDRASSREKSPISAPTIMRYAKPGELVLSMCGSPLATNGILGRFANINIPLRNGCISVQPRRLSGIKPELLENMDTETLEQLKTLHANLDTIVSMAHKAGF